MDLAGLRKQHSSAPLEESSEAPEVPSLTSVAAEGGSSSGDSQVGTGESPVGAEHPWGVAQVVTPSGIEVYYQAGPKRLYRLRRLDSTVLPMTDWVDVPSVSECLGILDKPGLPWWGMKVGVEGVMTLFDMVRLGTLDELEYLRIMAERDVDMAVGLLTQNKLTVNHVRDKAGTRGTAVHDALEVWANTGKLAPPNVFEEEERGYVQGLNDFLTDFGGEAFASEVMVGSLDFEFAGRFDLAADVPDQARVVVKSYPKRASKVEPIPGGRWLLDLKTSKGVYSSHHLQLAGYEIAYEESYGERFDHTGVIHVFPDGRYELIKGVAVRQDFLNVVALYDSLEGIRKS